MEVQIVQTPRRTPTASPRPALAGCDHLPATGMLLVDADLAVSAADHGARHILSSELVIAVLDGYLSTGSASVDERLRRAITSASSVRDIALPISGPGARRLALSVNPMAHVARGKAMPSLGHQAVVMIEIVVDRCEAAVDAVRAEYRLTAAETETLRMICKGLSTVEVASILGIAKSTTRTHLKRVFAKTGTSRQSELVHFVGTYGYH